MSKLAGVLFASLLVVFSLSACGDDGPEADCIGVGAQCSDDGDCVEEASCLTQFKGGYCGLRDCESDADCPEASACVEHEGSNYCFRICVDKAECNRNRSADNEANCSSSATFVNPDFDGKACLPPSK